MARRPKGTFSAEELDARVCEAIQQTIEKFRRDPQYFFTEGDLVSYCYHCLYTTHMETSGIQWVHREYPTVFRYRGKDMKAGRAEIWPPSEKIQGTSRGHYDLVVLDPDWLRRVIGEETGKVSHSTFVRLQSRRKVKTDGAKKDEYPGLRWVIEFKLVTSPSESYVTEVTKDNEKLRLTLAAFGDARWTREATTTAPRCVNLVFMNVPKRKEVANERLDRVSLKVRAAPSDFLNVLIYSALGDAPGKKTQYRPMIQDQPPPWSSELVSDPLPVPPGGVTKLIASGS